MAGAVVGVAAPMRRRKFGSELLGALNHSVAGSVYLDGASYLAGQGGSIWSRR